MEFEVMMKNRRSCRSYQDRAVSREDLVKIVEAGRLTPSGCNSQPWKFLVIDGEEATEKLRDALVLEGGIIIRLDKDGFYAGNEKSDAQAFLSFMKEKCPDALFKG